MLQPSVERGEREHGARLLDARVAIAAELRRARSRLALRQRDVAERAGISQETYRGLERVSSRLCGVNPTLDTLLRVSHVLGLDGTITGYACTVPAADEAQVSETSDRDDRSSEALPLDERVELLRHPPERA